MKNIGAVMAFAGGIANVGLLLPSVLMWEGSIHPFERGGIGDLLVWVILAGAFVTIGLGAAAYNRRISSVGMLIIAFALISGMSSIVSGNLLIAFNMGIALVGGIIIYLDAKKEA